MNRSKMNLLDQIADGVDLAIDFLTLGQYGLERDEDTAASDAGCEGGGHRGRREALPPARRRGLRPSCPQRVGAQPVV